MFWNWNSSIIAFSSTKTNLIETKTGADWNKNRLKERELACASSNQRNDFQWHHSERIRTKLIEIYCNKFNRSIVPVWHCEKKRKYMKKKRRKKRSISWSVIMAPSSKLPTSSSNKSNTRHFIIILATFPGLPVPLLTRRIQPNSQVSTSAASPPTPTNATALSWALPRRRSGAV